MIHDKYDPSGQGMFSKSGRQSGDARTMLERVINSQTAKNKKTGSFLANQMNPYQNILDDIITVQNDASNSASISRPSSAKVSNQKNHLYEYQLKMRQKIDTANNIEPFGKQITREQYNRPYKNEFDRNMLKEESIINVLFDQSQKVDERSKQKAVLVNEVPDPHKRKPKLVYDILKIYKTQQKFRQQTLQNAKELQNQQQQLMQQTQQQQTQQGNIFKSGVQTNPKEQQVLDSQLSRSFCQSPSNTKRYLSNTPNAQQQQQLQMKTQQSFNKSYIDQTQDLSRSQSPSKTQGNKDNVPAYPERVKKRVSGFTDFQRQINRSKGSYDKFNKVNEKRFEFLKESSVSSKVKHVRDYSFNKQLNREVVSAFKPDEKIPDNGYKPNFEVTKKSLGRVGPNFSRISPHKSLEKKLVGVFQGTHYEYDSWVKNRNKNSHVYKNNKLNLIPFNKQLSREQNPHHALPGYMQTVRSRISLQDLSQKMLEENSFMDMKFLNMNSVFSTKSSMSRQSTKSFTQQNFFRATSIAKSPSQRDRVQTSNSYQKTRGNSLRNNSSQIQITNNSFYY